MQQPFLTTANPEIEKDISTDVESELEKMWKVIIHNDEVTPIDFVIAILVKVFNRPIVIAEAIMWEAHNIGNAVVAAYPKQEAESLTGKAHFAARLEGYPLTFTMEEA